MLGKPSFKPLLPYIVAVLSVSSVARAQECRSYESQNYPNIRTATSFSLVAIGDSANTPPEQLEVRCILKRKDARSVFLGLAEKSTRPGQFFALTGLTLVAPLEARKMAQRLRKVNDEQVPVIAGCMMQDRSVSFLLDRLKAGGADRIVEPRPDVPEALNFSAEELAALASYD